MCVCVVGVCVSSRGVWVSVDGVCVYESGRRVSECDRSGGGLAVSGVGVHSGDGGSSSYVIWLCTCSLDGDARP